MINILYTSDNGYYNVLYVSMYSACKYSKNKIYFHVIQQKFSEKQKSILKDMVSEYNHIITFYDEPKLPVDLNVTGGRSEAAFYRICAASILSDNLDKIIYIDCDTIVLGDLSEIYNLDDDKIVYGVQDTICKKERKKIGLSNEDIYINSGVLVINLKKWRALHIEEKSIEYLTENKTLKNNDQDVINALCKNQIGIIEPKYNVMTTFFEYSRIQLMKIGNLKTFYSEEEMQSARENPVIIHYAGYIYERPWNDICDHPKKEIYEQLLSETCISKEKKIVKVSTLGKLGRILHRKLPFCIFICIKKIKRTLF